MLRGHQRPDEENIAPPVDIEPPVIPLPVEDPDDCAICLLPINLGDPTSVTPCFHTFHFPCLNIWTRTRNTCPTCRRRFDEVVVIEED